MEKTKNFFLIHNFNTVPTELLEYCDDYLIMDASTDEAVRTRLRELELRVVTLPNTGHNITSYFRYFAEHFEELPEVMCLCKGNLIGRHCSKEYFDRVYRNTWFTYLYEERGGRARYAKMVPGGNAGTTVRGKQAEEGIASLVSESQYIERNTSWYVESPNHPNRYFDSLDDLLLFIYRDPVLPRYCLFSPGACYIVRREQIRKHTPAFYRNLNKLMNYGRNPNFPSEAHMIERLLPVIYEASYEVNPWMNEEMDFDSRLLERRAVMDKKAQWEGKRLKRLRRLLGQERTL